MTTIPPSGAIPPPVPSTPSAGPAVPAGGPVTAVLTQVPTGLQLAGSGTVISGTVVGIDNQGQALLQTNAGPVVVQANVGLSVGQQISLKVQAGGTPLHAVILSAEAQATAELTSAVASGTPDLSAPEAATPATSVAPSVAGGSVIVATVIGPAAVAASGLPVQAGTTSKPSGGPRPPAGQEPPPAAAGLGGASGNAAPAARAQASPAASATPRAGTSGAGTAGASSAGPRLPPDTAVPQPSARSAPAVASGPSAPPPSGAPPASATSPTTFAPPKVASPSPAGAAPPAAQPTASDRNAPQPSTAARPISDAIASYRPPAAAGTGPAPVVPHGSTGLTPLPTPPAGTRVPLRLVGSVTSLTATATTAARGELVATVVAQTPAGQTIVDTAIGRLAFSAPSMADVAIGDRIAFEIAALATGPAGNAAATTQVAGRALAALTAAWPALKAALSTLAALNPGLAQQVVGMLPRPGSAEFLGQLLSLVGSPARDAKALLGDAAADALQQAGRGDVVSRLDADLREMTRLNASGTDWQVLYLPLLDPGEARQLRIFTRRRKPGAEPGRDAGARFIVEVDFAHVGPLQLDGLVQKPRLDLILRTHADFPAELRQGIVDVFTQTCEAAGLKGNLFFQAAGSFPVSPLDDMTASSASDLSV